MIDIIKVIYFDEGSATDFLSIINEGELIKEFIKYSENGSKASGELGIGAGISKLFGALKGYIDFESSLEGTFENSNLIKTTITNTILTDFINYVNSDKNKKDDYITELKKFKIYIPNNSIAMIQQITPYMLMTNNDLKIDEDISLKLDKMYESLEFAKGYYELIAFKGKTPDDKKIFRFNNKAFKNNYSISDLVHMDLIFYGIKVGQMNEKLLDFNNLIEEITLEENKKDYNLDVGEEIEYIFDQKIKEQDYDIDITGVGSKGSEETDLEYPIYDIILAGVDNG